jgi:MarR family transcriptional regulator, 2-MHQ and catechol-resistance regulon repressor
VKVPYEKLAFLPALRELVRCNQAFERFSAAHVRELGLTPGQFDVIATLGNTNGMTCGELGDKTLITKGTLSGILDRLEDRGLLRRIADRDDARRTIIALTTSGEVVFADAFPAHLKELAHAFDRMPSGRLKLLNELLAELRKSFEKESQR